MRLILQRETVKNSHCKFSTYRYIKNAKHLPGPGRQWFWHIKLNFINL